MPSLARRTAARARRELMFVAARLRWPAVEFGRGCDIRPGLRIALLDGGVVRFGSDCILDRDLTVECAGELVVGAGCIFGHHCTIGVKESVRIGANCLVAELVSIRDSDHGTANPAIPYRDQPHVTAPVIIGSNVWLGSRVVVTRGVMIGDNSIVGAGAVVTRDIPENSVAVGVPARVIRSTIQGRA